MPSDLAPIAYFVSDMHLGDDKDPKCILFLEWLQSLLKTPPQYLFLVGDIFDLWLGRHSYFIHRFQKIVDTLVELKRKGCEINYFEGNHDLYLADFWKKQLGFNVYEEPHYFQIFNKMFRIEHGDQMDPEDKGYIFLRWFLRTSIIRILVKSLPSSLVVKIGEFASQKSRAYTSQVKVLDEEKLQKKIRTYAEQMWEGQEFDFFIAGHVHMQDEYNFKREEKLIRTINLGSWFQDAKVLKFADSQLSWVELG